MYLKILAASILLLLGLHFSFPSGASAQAGCLVVSGGGGDADCSGTRICLPGVPKKLLPKIPEARPGYCGDKVDLIVMHTTHGGEQGAMDLWNYFASGSRYASTQLVVGRDGSMLQMLDLFSDKSEVGHAVGGANDRSISIELNNPGNYSSKAQVPTEQYQNALRLVKTLMQTYNVPISGVVSHGSLGGGAGDPGDGFMRDFVADLPGAQALDGSVTFPGESTTTTGSSQTATDASCVITKVGEPEGDPPPLPPECFATTTGEGFTPVGGSCQPVTSFPANISQDMQERWGITAVGFDESKMKLIYEVFTNIQQTGFLPLVKGAHITARDGASGEQVGCPGDGTTDVFVGTGFNDASFKQILVHELAHTIQFCKPDSISHFSEVGQAIAVDGPVSGYSQTLCLYGGGNEDIRRMEDYAEMISFHLNPDSGEVTCGSGPNPFQSGKTAHKALATKIVGAYSCN